MIRTSIAAFLIALSVSAYGAPQLRIENAWVREAPPGAPVHGGFLTLRNTGSDEAVVTGVESPRFARIEIHRTIMDGDMARMEQQDRLPIPAGEQLELAPGGYHLMLFEAASRPRKGETIPFVLVLEGGPRIEFQAQVRRDRSAGAEHHKNHQH